MNDNTFTVLLIASCVALAISVIVLLGGAYDILEDVRSNRHEGKPIDFSYVYSAGPGYMLGTFLTVGMFFVLEGLGVPVNALGQNNPTIAVSILCVVGLGTVVLALELIDRIIRWLVWCKEPNVKFARSIFHASLLQRN